MKEQTVFGWHFSTGKCGFGDGRKLTKRWQTMTPKGGAPLLGVQGMHATTTPLDALKYATGSIISYVKLRGDIQYFEGKMCARERRVIKQADATMVLHRFLIWRAARMLKKASGVAERNCWDALRTKGRWLRGLVTDDELAEAQATARDTARGAAAEAQHVRNAEWAAAGAASRCAWSEAGAAARDAWSAARAAARDALPAWAEERAIQNAHLERKLRRLLGMEVVE